MRSRRGGQTSQVAMTSARRMGMLVPFSDDVASTRGKAAGRLAIWPMVRATTASTSAGLNLSA